MQTRSGKTYTTAASSSMEKNKTRVETTVDNGGPKYAGFIQPNQISNELAKFLGKPVGSKMYRPDVSRGITNYINTNKLQDSENGRIIHADEKLRKLLKLGRNDELTYFNLQRYLGPHLGGFVVQPKQISNELAKFLGKPVGTKMYRSDVSRGITKYINTNKLLDSESRSIIHPDEKLRKLLKLGRNDELSYFNIQGYLRPHFATA
jgi:chromatin remodeling complex protein RSC6